MNTDLTPRTAWWTDARFGLFIHYGIYSLTGEDAWVRSVKKLDESAYARYFDHFSADRFDAREWARTARLAGMRYVVFTTKHHDGFCLWNSDLTTYSSAHTQAGRDLVEEVVDAFRAEGLKIGLYHSLIDWHHPDFPVDGFHPDWERSGGNDAPVIDGSAYVDYLHAQVEDLVTRFSPDVLWFDFAYPGDTAAPRGKGADFWLSKELVARIRELAPNVLINDRLDLPGSEDYVTPEETQPSAEVVDGESRLWEACRTLNGSWAYAPSLVNWLDAGQVVRLLVDSVSKGGNLLLNVGPTGRGDMEPRAQELLAEVGNWLGLHADSVYGAGSSKVPAPPGCRVTQHGRRVFVHLFDWPVGHLVLTGLPARLRFASFVHDGVEVPLRVVDEHQTIVPHEVQAGPPGSTLLMLPSRRPQLPLAVIELDLEW
jgi:alpha-L-fucosidase